MWPQTGEIGPRCVLLPTSNQPCGRPKMSMNTSLLISLVILTPSILSIQRVGLRTRLWVECVCV